MLEKESGCFLSSSQSCPFPFVFALHDSERWTWAQVTLGNRTECCKNKKGVTGKQQLKLRLTNFRVIKVALSCHFKNRKTSDDHKTFLWFLNTGIWCLLDSVVYKYITPNKDWNIFFPAHDLYNFTQLIMLSFCSRSGYVHMYKTSFIYQE